MEIHILWTFMKLRNGKSTSALFKISLLRKNVSQWWLEWLFFRIGRFFCKATHGMFPDLHTALSVLSVCMNQACHCEGGLRKYCCVAQTLLHFLLICCPPRGNVSPAAGAFAIYQPLYGHCSSLPKFFFFFLPLDCLFSKNAFSHFPFTSACWSSPLVPQRWNDTGVSGVFSARIPFVLNACYANKAAASLGSALGDRLSDIIHQICACIWEEDEARRGRSALISQFWGSH